MHLPTSYFDITEAVFFYHGQPRLQLFFESPNQCATVLGMLLVVSVPIVARVLFTGCKTRAPCNRLVYYRIAQILGIAWIIVGLTGLVLTYSRGGWIAFLSGLLFLGIVVSSQRKWYLWILIFFVAAIQLMPEASSRAISMTDENDLSVAHRIMVWRGAMAITARNWVEGCGVGNFGSEYSAWYEPLQTKAQYHTALNNLLTLGAERGIFSIALYLLATVVPFWVACIYAVRSNNTYILGLLATQVIFFTSGLFSYSLTIWDACGFFWLTHIRIVYYGITHLLRERIFSFSHSFLPPVYFTCTICLIIFATGAWQLRQLVVLPSAIPTGNYAIGNAVLIKPQKGSINGLIIYYHDSDWDVITDGQEIIRPLASMGFDVITINCSDSGFKGLGIARYLNKWVASQPNFKDIPRYLLGSGLGGRLAILSACYDQDLRFRGVASIGAEADWPFPSLSPINHISTLSCPLLILHGRDDTEVAVDQAYRLKKLCDLNKQRSQLLIYDGVGHDFNGSMANAINNIADFYKKNK